MFLHYEYLPLYKNKKCCLPLKSLKHSCLQTRSSVHSALEIFLLMRYINLRLLTYLLIMWLALKRTGFGVYEVWSDCEPVVWLDHNRCSKWRPFAFTHARSRVCHWSMALSMMPWRIRSQVSMSLWFSLSVSRFGFGGVNITKVRRQNNYVRVL